MLLVFVADVKFQLITPSNNLGVCSPCMWVKTTNKTEPSSRNGAWKRLLIFNSAVYRVGKPFLSIFTICRQAITPSANMNGDVEEAKKLALDKWNKGPDVKGSLCERDSTQDN